MRTSTTLASILALTLACAPSMAQSEGSPGTPADDQGNGRLSVGSKAPALSMDEIIKGKPVEGLNEGTAYVVEFWATWCPPCVASIPHLTKLQKKHKNIVVMGVAGSERSGQRLLFVGQWLRDFRLLRKAMPLIWAENPTVELDCVVPLSARERPEVLALARDQRVHWHANVSADRLRELYQQADLLFLPLLDATANNAVVEAIACGLPVISTDVGGIPDYVPPEAGQLCPAGDALAHATATLQWLGDGTRRRRAALAARQQAEAHLDWAHIGQALAKTLGLTSSREI
jgi:glycosyltransferase involved in cell wall biosynthesis